MNHPTTNAIGSAQVPEQVTGSQMDAEEKVECSSEQVSKEFYESVKARLLNVNSWWEISKLPLSSFKLFDYAGREADRLAAEGDFIRIDIPGPGTQTGKGYDWVMIESITEEVDGNAEAISMRVRPSAHPLGPDEHTAHFLKRCATSTFQVKRIGKEVFAEEHARNEKVNLNTGHLLDNIRNAVIGVSAKIGFSYPQWKSLVAGLVTKTTDL